MTTPLLSASLTLLWFSACPPTVSASQEVEDPAPPTPRELAKRDPPPALPHPDVTRHAAPGALSPNAMTADWPCFLGPDGRNESRETWLARTWDEGRPPLVWELAAGDGYAAPAIQGERLVYFHRVGNEEVVECLHPETGARYWDLRYSSDYRDSFGYSNGPRCTPLLEEDRVYTYGAQGDLHCLKLSTGQLVWKRNLCAEFEVPQDFFGVSSTPVLHGEHLIVHVGSPGGPCVISLDKNTGRLRWASGGEWQAGYSTPVIAPVHGKPRCFVFAGGKRRPPSGGLICLDPETGAIDFQFPWRSDSYESVNASSPVVIGDRVFVSASYDTGGALLRMEPDGGYELQWKSDVLGTHFNTSIHRDGYLYGFDGRNEPDASLVCQELATGKEMWREVLSWEDTFELHGRVGARQMSVYRGTLLSIDGDFLCLGEQGHLLWLELTPQGCKVLSRAWLFAAYETWTPPVVSRGLLYVTQNARDFVTGDRPRLLCYDLRRQDR